MWGVSGSEFWSWRKPRNIPSTQIWVCLNIWYRTFQWFINFIIIFPIKNIGILEDLSSFSLLKLAFGDHIKPSLAALVEDGMMLRHHQMTIPARLAALDSLKKVGMTGTVWSTHRLWTGKWPTRKFVDLPSEMSMFYRSVGFPGEWQTGNARALVGLFNWKSD